MARLTYFFTALSGLTLFSLPTAFAGTPSPGCGKEPTLTSPDRYNLTINGKERNFYIRLPENYDNSHAYKYAHCSLCNMLRDHQPSWMIPEAEQVVAGTDGYLPWYGLPALDDDAGGDTAVYIAAQGLKNSAEFGGQLPGWANVDGEDLALVDGILERVEADLCVDREHRYSTGFSYGGAFSYALACDRAALFRAVAVLSGAPLSGCAAGTEPVAYLGQHGVSDQVLPMALGRELRDRFLANNGCAAKEAAEPAAGSGTHMKTVYEGCTHPVTFIAFDGDHTPQPIDAGANQTYAAEETWAFFSQFAQT